MPKRITPHQATRVKNNSYKRENRDQYEDEDFDHNGKKQSDYRRMQSSRALQEYFDTFNK